VCEDPTPSRSLVPVIVPALTAGVLALGKLGCVSGRPCVMVLGSDTGVSSRKAPRRVVTVGLTTSEHRILRVVSCRSRSHPRPPVSVVGQQRITSASPSSAIPVGADAGVAM
jgi:hypothetical protein